MSVDENKQIARLFFQEQDRLKGGPADNLCAPGYTAQIGGNPPTELTGHQHFAQMFYAAFPDMYHVVEDTVADVDAVMARFTIYGTHTHDFMGIPATGRSVTIRAMALFEIVDGKVARLHGQFDQMGMLQQLGVVPTASQTV